MAQFDFNNSRYAKFFSSKSNINFLQTFISTEGLLDVNNGWWKTQFTKAAAATPTDATGAATFTVKSRNMKAAPMMDLRAPLGDSTPLDNEGLMFYSATIPDFIAPGIVETATERKYKEEYMKQFGNDADIVAQWIQKVQTQYDSANASVSNMGAQLISKGYIDYNFGRGIKSPLHKANIPAENFVKAGAKVWTATDCQLLDQMVKKEQDFRDRTGFTGAMKWQMPKDIYLNVFLKNTQVAEWVKSYRTLNDKPVTAGMVITEELYKEVPVYPGLSPIEIVVEKQRNLTWSSDEMIHGWNPTAVVLRPSGFAGEIQYTNIMDKEMHEQYGASTIQKTFAMLESGLFMLVNTTLNNGNYKEWHTDLMASCVPSLLEFPYHVIVDTATAD